MCPASAVSAPVELRPETIPPPRPPPLRIPTLNRSVTRNPRLRGDTRYLLKELQERLYLRINEHRTSRHLLKEDGLTFLLIRRKRIGTLARIRRREFRSVGRERRCPRRCNRRIRSPCQIHSFPHLLFMNIPEIPKEGITPLRRSRSSGEKARLCQTYSRKRFRLFRVRFVPKRRRLSQTSIRNPRRCRSRRLPKRSRVSWTKTRLNT